MKKIDLTYEVKGLVPEPVIVSLRSELVITEDIDTEVDRAAAMFGYYAVLSEKAETRYERLKMAFETWIAEKEAQADEERELEGKKKFTVTQMKSYVRSIPKYKSFQLKLIDLEEQKRVLKVLARAFEKKADMIQTKACNRRREIER